MITAKENELTDEYIDKDNKIIIYQNNFYKNAQLTSLLTLIVIPLLFIRLERFEFNLIRVIAMFILVFSFTIIMVRNLEHIGKVIQRDKINKALLIYLGLLLISIPFSGNIKYSTYGAPGRIEGLITILLYMYLFLIARISPKLSDKQWIMVMITGLLVSSIGIIQFYGYYPLADEVFKSFGGRPYSTMGNPNFLGTYFVLIIPVSMYLYIMKSKKIGLVGFSVLLYCLLGTSTRGAWLGTIASMIAFFMLHRFICANIKFEWKKYLIMFLVAVIVVLLFNYQTDGRLLNRFLSISNDAKDLLTNNEESDYAGAHRGFIWKRVIEMIGEKPIFGYGIENLQEPFIQKYKSDMIEFWGGVRGVDKAHNEYLNIAVTSGIPSLIAYLFFLINIIKIGFKNLKSNPIIILLMSSIMGYLVQAFFNISMVVTAYVFWVYLGLISQNFSKNKEM